MAAKIRFLYSSTEIKNAIKSIFSDARQRRVAITAFVGDSANAYLPKPKGIELYCWPKAGGTNPDALRYLLTLGVKIYFSESLHMKIYWASGKEVIITSANLSTNALGAGGLKEIGVHISDSQVNIDKIISSIKARPLSTARLLRLDKEHKRFNNLNDHNKTRSNVPSFRSWYQSPSRSAWQLSSFVVAKLKLATNAKAILEREHGATAYTDLMTAPSNIYEEDDWILCYNKETENARWASWMYADHVVKVSAKDKKAYDKENPCQVIQVSKLKAYGTPPFRTDRKFKRAFAKAVQDYGGIEKLDNLASSKPPPKLIDLIYKHYKK